MFSTTCQKFYDDWILRDKKEMGETNDCAVRALAIVCGTWYGNVLNRCRHHGRINNNGTSNDITKKVLGDYQLQAVDVTHRFSTKETIGTFHRVCNKKYTYLVNTEEHIFAIINGWTYDKTPMSTTIEEIHQVVVNFDRILEK